MNMRLLLPLSLAALAACNSPTSDPSTLVPAEDRFHEKSFSWSAAARDPGLAKTAGRATRFETEEQLREAIAGLEERIRLPGYSDSLWKPIDYACDELALALWNAHGTVRLRDSVVMDESILKAGCRYIGDDSARAPAETDGAAKSAAVYPTAVETDRQYPYKMIGESWDDFDIAGYRSTGGETQFKKHREKFGFTGWYDTDASRIGVRIYLFSCATVGTRMCEVWNSKSDWYSNDDYVSKRDFAIGGKFELTPPAPGYGGRISGATGLNGFQLGIKASDAVISMHSVNHAGLQFRAVSSSGLSSNTEAFGPFSYNYVTW